ncbi:MAG: FkbM family methyltransferase [Candidatus Pacebacteria bacterium]|nr:FkbM family methyltransferase [Candidatus Paceibacterota bacterium]
MKNISTKVKLKLLKRKRRFTPGTLKTSFGAIHYIDSLSTYHQYKTIVDGGIYDISDLSPKPKYIIDCGANIGISTLYFANKYPEAKIRAFEPQPDAFASLQTNLAGKTNVELIKKAVWDKEGTLELDSSASDASSLTTTAGNNTITVETTSLIPYLSMPVDLLKIDIEGAEYTVLKNIESILSMVKNIFIEYHVSNLGNQELGDILAMLTRSGFNYYLSPESVPGAPFKNMRRAKSGRFYYQINIFASRL